MDTLLTFAELHVRVEDWPELILVGLAVREIVGVVAVGETVIFTDALVTEPALSQN